MLKKLAASIRQFKKASILSPLFVICEVILEVMIPLLMAKLIDYGIDQGDMPYILKMGAGLIVAALFTIMFGYFAGKYAAAASAGLARNLRQDMFYNVQNFS
ncbi:MAG: ABC transporter ATP-binding protein, partial [Bacillus sp. (in: firmicutes)]